MTRLAWGDYVSEEFCNKVLEICKNFGWSEMHASWLMACMAFESGETFRSNIKNAAGSGATGLIQFMPSTARGLGTTTDELAKMPEVVQLDFVELYFKPYAKRIASLSDMYMAILMPKYIGKADNAILFSGGIAYRQNSGLDANRDGVVTKLEASAKVYQKLVKGLEPIRVRDID